MSDSPPRQARRYEPHWRAGKISSLIGTGLLLLFLVSAVYWFGFRVEVNANEILVLVNKTGKLLPSELRDEFGDQVVLYPDLVRKISEITGDSEEDVRNDYKGIRYEVVTEGRYFFNPYSYKRLVFPTTLIKQNEVGVLMRKYGKPLPFPKTVATEPDERGPVDEILQPARHNVNPFAYEVQKFPAIQVPEGHVGVVTLLSGTDPTVKNTYTVEPGDKGVQRETLTPGLYYFNPYLKKIEVVDVRSQKYDMLDADAIHFPSSDSFTITIEGTIEWAIRPDHVAEVTVAYGDKADILGKIILPNARSIARIQGSKLKAREFISGKTRTAFQSRLLAELKRDCWEQGINIKAALVRDIELPGEIASPISQREQADQEIDRYTNQMEEGRAEALLVEQEEMQDQNRALGDARRDVVSIVKEAEQHKVVSVTRASREFEVAKLALEAAEKEAAALVSRGQAEANVILFNYQARAEPLSKAVAAFGDGATYAQQFFLQKVAPSIKSILSNTEGPFSDIFKEFQSFKSQSARGGNRS
ncbi:MAG: SPFH domain-containing protein [Phycisphaerae bacterium]